MIKGWIDSAIGALFGLLIGSFLNVCIYRWPRDRSVVRPRSACPECGTQIAWYDNIPVLSYAILQARCRQCGTNIHWRYPVVELLTAVAFARFAGHYGLGLAAVKYCVFSAILIALVFTDVETLLLPDELTIGGLLIGLAFAAFAPASGPTFLYAIYGAIIPAGFIWLGGWLFEKIRHKQGLGFGDVKMLAMIGAFLGLYGTLLTIIVGSLVGSIAGLAYIKAAGKDPATYHLPFGSFLGAAALFTAVMGQGVIAWYTRLIR
jgi:leader peptidase (prepilin peptidase) / N-methyltransferase